MPNWDTTPPKDLARSGYRLLRTPAAHPLVGHVLSDNLVGCNTHFVGNRTVPCEPPDCDPCQSGVPWRWHGYLLIVVDATQEMAIFETTARAAEAFAAYHQRYGTTRGAHFIAKRVNGRANGRVLIQARPSDLAKLNLPAAFPVEKLLCHIWNIPTPQVELRDSKTRPPFDQAQVNKPANLFPIPLATPAHVPNIVADVLKQTEGNGNRSPR